MTQEYFKCKPGELCDGAMCCRSMETHLLLTMGDYLRLSEYTGEPLTQIWKTKGSLVLSSYPDMRKGEFLLNLSLLHDPCPYLSEKHNCTIYEIRPISCASFPLGLYLFHDEQIKTVYKGYRCLQGVQPKPEQIELGREIANLVDKESQWEIDFFWGGKLLYIHIPTIGGCFQLALNALNLQANRDPKWRSKRSQELEETVTRMHSLYKDLNSEKGVDIKLFTYLMSKVMFSILEDEIAKKFDSLDTKVLELHKETSQRWKELSKKIE